MALRIACPRCETALTVSERGAGKVVRCLKCREPMRIPVPVVESIPRPIPEARIRKPKAAPSPPPSPRKDEWRAKSDPDTRERPKRSFRPVRTKPRSMMPWAVLGGAVSLLIVMIVAVAVVWNLKSQAIEQAKRDAATKPDDPPKRNTKSPTPETPARPKPDKPNSPQPDTPNPPKPVPAKRPIEGLPELPEGWSYNRDYGFVAAWPVPPGPDGLTPDQSTARGRKSPFGDDRFWMSIGPDESTTLGMSYESPSGPKKDPKTMLDEYFAKLIKQVPATYAIRDDIDVGDRTGRELRYTKQNQTVILRAVVVYSTIWSVRVSYLDDRKEIAERFLNSFIAYEYERTPTGNRPVIKKKPSPPPPNPDADKPKPDKPKRATPPLPVLAKGWSYNSPTLGFVAAWPTVADTDGFTPERMLGDGRFGAFGGSKWGMTVGKTQSVTLGVSVQVLLDKTIDEKKTLDDYIAKLIKEIPFGYELRPECKIGDRIGREIKFPDKNNKTVILRAVIADNAIWSVQTTYLDDEKTISEKFINSFIVP
jgi:nitrogen fixation-related uncharacterized protein